MSENNVRIINYLSPIFVWTAITLYVRIVVCSQARILATDLYRIETSMSESNKESSKSSLDSIGRSEIYNIEKLKYMGVQSRCMTSIETTRKNLKKLILTILSGFKGQPKIKSNMSMPVIKQISIAWSNFNILEIIFMRKCRKKLK